MRAEIVVDVAAIRHNVRRLGEVTGTPVMTVVKADGYGHGLLESARAAREGGAAWLGVATLDEALALRAGGDTGPLLCWLTVPSDDPGPALAAGVDVTAYTTEELDRIAAARVPGARVQLKVDTGLSRGGALPADWPALVERARRGQEAGELTVTGVWSHLARSDEPDEAANDEQQRVFDEALAVVEAAGLRPEVRHLANSAAALLRPQARYDLVRCGIASYGLDPAPGVTPPLGLRPAMTARASLALTKRVEAGASVSYGHTWTAERATTLGLVPVGYADGVPRIAGNRAEVWVAGARRPVRGRVCMDQLVVDLGDLGDLDEDLDDDLSAGAEAVLFGPGDRGEPTAQDWAEACETISYEIVSRIGGRMVRRHVDSDVHAPPDKPTSSQTEDPA
ncbi:alanine racemase [Nocardioides flavescens]|uniref:alanine racemase n=1 Tax=Nocardioides flavescens TaxID=2691959 RepID=UPI003F6DBCA3